VSSPSDRGISAYARVVALGVLRRAVCWDGKKSALSVAAPALQASGRHRTTLVRDAHCLGSARWWVESLCLCVRGRKWPRRAARGRQPQCSPRTVSSVVSSPLLHSPPLVRAARCSSRLEEVRVRLLQSERRRGCSRQHAGLHVMGVRAPTDAAKGKGAADGSGVWRRRAHHLTEEKPSCVSSAVRGSVSSTLSPCTSAQPMLPSATSLVARSSRQQRQPTHAGRCGGGARRGEGGRGGWGHDARVGGWAQTNVHAHGAPAAQLLPPPLHPIRHHAPHSSRAKAAQTARPWPRWRQGEVSAARRPPRQRLAARRREC